MASQEPPSPFEKLRVRTTFGLGSRKILILSLSKGEDFHPDQRPRAQQKRPRIAPGPFPYLFGSDAYEA